MKKHLLSILCASLWAGGSLCQAGPFDPETWPSVVNTNKVVHYTSTDGNFDPLGPAWSKTIAILSGGDQNTENIALRGHQGLKVTGNNMNLADSSFTDWATTDTIDILMQVYGDGAILSGTNARNYNFLIGTLPELDSPVGGQIAATAKNQKWNWVLFRIPNGTRASDGTRLVGSIPANAQGAYTFGGVNSGTIRVQEVPGLIVRFVAFGEQGAFGEPADYADFEAPDTCDPEPPTNLAFIDFQHGTSNHLTILNDHDQLVEIVDGVGPANDQRRAARAQVSLMNFGVIDNYLGKTCNNAQTMKVCVEFYDDPALTGVRFGPEAYATDAAGGIGFFNNSRYYTLRGSGTWMRVAFVVPAVNLKGVNIDTLTGGPRLFFQDGTPYISRYDLGIIRQSPHPLAGLDPVPDAYEDPLICTDTYGNFAEMNLANGVLVGLEPGTSTGDQEMIQGEAGPANDRRLAIRPALDDGSPQFTHDNLNLAISGQIFGPSTQPNAHLTMCINYYDDSALIGKTFRPEVYSSDRNGVTTLGFTPGNSAVVIEGTDRWREAYFELPDVKFNGVNQQPQAAARFRVTGKIFFSRVRYAVIRPCGPYAGINLLADHKSPTLRINYLPAVNKVSLSWTNTLEGWSVQKSDGASGWQTVTNQPTVQSGNWVLPLDANEATSFFRLKN